MLRREEACGRAGCVAAAGLCLLLAVHLNTYPFLDKESVIYSYVPDPKWVLLACAAWGFCFIGGLMLFTFYHIYPHL